MILDRLLGRHKSSENPRNPITDEDDPLAPNHPDHVSRKRAHMVSAYWRGLNLVSGYVAKLPAKVNRRVAEDSWEVDRSHPAYKLVHRQANPRTTAQNLRKVLTKHALGDGNGYAVIDREGTRPVALWQLGPEDTFPVIYSRNGKEFDLEYFTTVRGHSLRLQAADVLHIKGMSDDGIEGLNTSDYANGSIGLSLDTLGFARMYFVNGMQPSGLLLYPRRLKQPAIDNLRRSFEKAHTGLNQAFRLMILEEGAKYEQKAIDNEKAQFLQTREFQLTDLANFMGIQPHKLGDKQRQAYASLEQENQAFLDETLDFWLVEWEGEYQAKLLTEQERETESHNIKFVRNAVVSTDIQSRFRAYNTALMGGWITRNEIRAREEMNPLPGGDDPYVPLNMGIVNEQGQTETVGEDREDIRAAHRQLVRWALERAQYRIVSQARRLASTPEKVSGLCRWLDADELSAECAKHVLEYLGPPLEACRAAKLTTATEQGVAFLLMSRVREDLLRIVDQVTPAEIYNELDQYGRAGTVAEGLALKLIPESQDGE